ncbi:hypothetical protein X011_13150 [Mycobacterium tuberculosis variant microti OV254]|nr:hypothetical protein X011_13150 [Mycobacterium tuberculosis variant microti OV254]
MDQRQQTQGQKTHTIEDEVHEIYDGTTAVAVTGGLRLGGQATNLG